MFSGSIPLMFGPLSSLHAVTHTAHKAPTMAA
jgi:hypothetical protein